MMFFVPSAVPAIAGGAMIISGASKGPIHGEGLVWLLVIAGASIFFFRKLI
jgi:hypothetical protein